MVGFAPGWRASALRGQASVLPVSTLGNATDRGRKNRSGEGIGSQPNLRMLEFPAIEFQRVGTAWSFHNADMARRVLGLRFSSQSNCTMKFDRERKDVTRRALMTWPSVRSLSILMADWDLDPLWLSAHACSTAVFLCEERLSPCNA